MIVTRVLIACLLLGLCVMTGRAKVRKLHMRSKALGDLLGLMRQLEVLIRVNGRPIPDALQACSRRSAGLWTGRLAEDLAGLYQARSPSAGLWQAALKGLAGEAEEAAALAPADIQILSLFGDQLASSDIKSIGENYSFLYSRMEESIQASDRDRAVKGKLYNTVGILAGLAAAIVVI